MTIFPVECIIGRFLESAEMSESPCHAISVAFIIAQMLGVSAYDAGYVPADARFLSYAEYQCVITF